MTTSRGYKVLEYVIVAAVLLAIGSAVAPAVTRASGEERTIGAIDALHYMRCQIDYYRAIHDGSLPAERTDSMFWARVMNCRDNVAQESNEMPVNPFNGLNTMRFSDKADQGTGRAGWHFNTINGEIHADDDPAHAGL
jgi:hypothetical protein